MIPDRRATKPVAPAPQFHPLRALLVLATVVALVVIFLNAGVLAGVGVMLAQTAIMIVSVAAHDRVRRPLQRLLVLVPTVFTMTLIAWAATLLLQ